MFNFYTDENGNRWFTSPLLAAGDYLGDSVCEANIRYLENQEGVEHRHNHGAMFSASARSVSLDVSDDTNYVVVFEAYNSRMVLVRECEATEWVQESLANYPVFDDMLLCEVEVEYQTESLPDIFRELLYLLNKEYPTWEEWYKYTKCPKLNNEYPEDVFDEIGTGLISEAVGLSGTEWIYENNYAFVRAEKIYEEWRLLFFDAIRTEFATR